LRAKDGTHNVRGGGNGTDAVQWNISDDLGQIAYIFSDKTGTLTQNVMEFQRCSVGGLAYGEGITESMVGAAKREGRDLSALDPAQNGSTLQVARESMIEAMQRLYKNRWLQTNKLTLVSPQLVHDLADRSSEQRRRLIDFFRALAICHTVLADRSDAPSIDYKAESPDEAALSAGARDLGFVFLSRSVSSIELEVMGQPERWAPLRVLEFNSTRKRMSIIVRAPDGRIHLITKGADSVIYQRLRSDHDQESKQAMTRDLEDFATGGLRTLCVGSRILGEEEFTDWARTYDAACSSIEDDREDQIEKACELIEHNLTLLGATGLEDKLQVGVPDAIQQLHLAGIRLWILTGDKLQTAIEISFACNVLQPSFEIFILSSETLEGARSQVEAGLDQIQKARTRGDLSQQFAVVIDGDTLRYALDASIKALFLELTTQCETVVCCRVSPAQKAQTVRLVRGWTSSLIPS
jgi:phospholipid-translocating ATPase